MEIARRTAALNRIEHLVNVYLSDSLKQIPLDERWDLVVGNPPHFLPTSVDDKSLIWCDPEWNVHRRFYARIKGFMKPGGHVVMLEDQAGSNFEDFRPMIEGGGGQFVAAPIGRDIDGRPMGHYYVISRW